MEQIYYVKDHPTVPNMSSIIAKGSETVEYVNNNCLLDRLKEIAEINAENYCTALFVFC